MARNRIQMCAVYLVLELSRICLSTSASICPKTTVQGYPRLTVTQLTGLYQSKQRLPKKQPLSRQCVCSSRLLGKFGMVRFSAQASQRRRAEPQHRTKGNVTPADAACRDVIGTPPITCKNIQCVYTSFLSALGWMTQRRFKCFFTALKASRFKSFRVKY